MKLKTCLLLALGFYVIPLAMIFTLSTLKLAS